MSRPRTRSAAALALVAALAAGALSAHALWGARAHAQAPQRGKITGFMRPKLDHSKAVLEGLALENYDLIARNARAMKELSEAAEWKVSPSVMYLRYSGEFQRLADELAEQAKQKDIDGATLAYLQLTINCVNCHKYVRENKILSGTPGGGGDVLLARSR